MYQKQGGTNHGIWRDFCSLAYQSCPNKDLIYWDFETITRAHKSVILAIPSASTYQHPISQVYLVDTTRQLATWPPNHGYHPLVNGFFISSIFRCWPPSRASGEFFKSSFTRKDRSLFCGITWYRILYSALFCARAYSCLILTTCSKLYLLFDPRVLYLNMLLSLQNPPLAPAMNSNVHPQPLSACPGALSSLPCCFICFSEYLYTT